MLGPATGALFVAAGAGLRATASSRAHACGAPLQSSVMVYGLQSSQTATAPVTDSIKLHDFHMTALVSIYIPTKNRVALLRRAVRSVLAQTARQIELIVVSDGSSDLTCDYIASINGDIPVRLIHNRVSVGACAARNQAIDVARGKFITGLDDDDFFMPHRIECFLRGWQRMQRAGLDFSCLFDSRIVDDGAHVFSAQTDDVVNAEQILHSNAIGNQVFTTRERMVAAGLFDPAMPAWQDWEMWVRLLNQFGPALNIHTKSYYSDISHEFERITHKSPDKILRTAQLFYTKHCAPRHMAAILLALESYPQVRLTVNDLMLLFLAKQARVVVRSVLRGKMCLSFTSSLASA